MKYQEFNLRNGETVTIPIATSYKDCAELVKSDYYRIYGKKDSLFKIWRKTHINRALQILFWVRMASYKGIFYPFALKLHNHYKNKYDVRIHAWAKIGYGLYIGHGMSMCVNSNAVIGNNVNLSQMINIGTNNKKSAIIGDEVYIGPLTSIVGDVEIGSRSIVGSGSVVVKDIPSDKTAVGVPAKVIGENKHPNYVNKKWNI